MCVCAAGPPGPASPRGGTRAYRVDLRHATEPQKDIQGIEALDTVLPPRRVGAWRRQRGEMGRIQERLEHLAYPFVARPIRFLWCGQQQGRCANSSGGHPHIPTLLVVGMQPHRCAPRWAACNRLCLPARVARQQVHAVRRTKRAACAPDVLRPEVADLVLHRAVRDGLAGRAHPQPDFRLGIFGAEAELARGWHKEPPAVPPLVDIHCGAAPSGPARAHPLELEFAASAQGAPSLQNKVPLPSSAPRLSVSHGRSSAAPSDGTPATRCLGPLFARGAHGRGHTAWTVKKLVQASSGGTDLLRDRRLISAVRVTSLQYLS